MAELEQQVKDAGITVMNEIGVSYILLLKYKVPIISSILESTIYTQFPRSRAYIRQEERLYHSCHTVEVSQLQKV